MIYMLVLVRVRLHVRVSFYVCAKRVSRFVYARTRMYVSQPERKKDRERMYERQREVCIMYVSVYERRDIEYLCIGVYPCISFTHMYIFLPFFYIYICTSVYIHT